MKRAFDSTGDLGSEDAMPPSAPKIRRAFSDGDSSVGASNSSSSSGGGSVVGALGASLQDKNRFMSLDIFKKRREIYRLRSDLVSATTTSRQKEADVAVAHAMLSEFDVWLRALLGSSGIDGPSTANKSSLLDSFLSLDSHPLESVDLHAAPLDIDDWTSEEAFEAALLKKAPIAPSETIRTLLQSNVDSLKHALAKLLKTVSSVDASKFESACAGLLKQSEAERARLQLEIASMKTAIKEASKELFQAEKRRKAAEKQLDKLSIEEAARQSQAAAVSTVALPSPAEAAPTSAAMPPVPPTAVASSDASGSVASSSGGSSAVDEAVVKQYTEKIEALEAQLAVLTKQLEQTDSLRSAAERALNEHISSSKTDSDAAVLALKAAYESRIAALDNQICTLLGDLATSENLATSIESKANEAIESLTSKTQAKIAELEASLDESHKNLSIAAAESQNTTALKNQVTELLVTIETMKSECIALREQRKQHIIATERLEKHLSECRTREAQHAGGDSGRSAREQELEVELEDARAQVNDLILEIETVMETEEKVKAQIISLHQQLADNQKLQRSLVEENASLKHDISTRASKSDEATKKVESLQALVSQQNSTISRCRETEQRLHGEIQKLRKAGQEFQQKIDALTAQSGIEAKKIQDLSAQMTAIKSQLESKSSSYERERSERMKLEVEKSKARKQAVGGSSASSSSSAGGPLGDKDRELLNVTLDMLRCSVCRDRFKSVAITRCFHMFCRDCIEENLRNRQRKCPACGDKFGQDDVRNVYFTH